MHQYFWPVTILVSFLVFSLIRYMVTKNNLPPYPSGNVIDLTDVNFDIQTYEKEFTFPATNTIVFTVYNPNHTVATFLTDARMSFVSDNTISNDLTSSDTLHITNPTINPTMIFNGPYGGGSNPYNQLYFNGNLSILINGSIVTLTTTNLITYIKFVTLKSNLI